MKLTDAKLKSIIAFLLKNKAELVTLTDYFEYEDIEKGLLLLPDYLVNVGIKDRLLKAGKIDEYLKDYSVVFQNDYIMMDLRLNLKQLGPVAAKYMLSVKDFNFSQGGCRIYGTFKEDVTSLGNVMQSMALKALLTNSTCIQKATQLTGCDFIFVDGHNIMIDLSKFDAVKKISEALEINYTGCNDGQLKFSFYYVG